MAATDEIPAHPEPPGVIARSAISTAGSPTAGEYGPLDGPVSARPESDPPRNIDSGRSESAPDSGTVAPRPAASSTTAGGVGGAVNLAATVL
jgi:hypothetical protein